MSNQFKVSKLGSQTWEAIELREVFQSVHAHAFEKEAVARLKTDVFSFRLNLRSIKKSRCLATANNKIWSYSFI